MAVYLMQLYLSDRSGRGTLLGVAPIKLEEADVFGETTREKILDSYSDLSKVCWVEFSMVEILETFIDSEVTGNRNLLKCEMNLKQKTITCAQRKQ